MKPYGTAISTVVLEKDQGAGDSTPSNNDIQNGTEVPAPDGDSNKSRGNKKGAGVLTPSIERKQGVRVSTPSNDGIKNGTEVPAPITNENYTSARLKDIYLKQRQNSIKSSL